MINTDTQLSRAQKILKAVIIQLGHVMLQRITQSTVNWINSGFHGSPLFVQNPSQFFGDIGKYEIMNLVNMTGYNSSNYPFGKAWSLNIINQYKNASNNNMQYSLSKVMNDPTLYMNNFNTGGWNMFLINTQYPQNNYMGYNMLATQDLARRLQGTVQNNAQKVQTTLNQGMGFLSPKKCTTNSNYNNGINEYKPKTYDYTYFDSQHPYPTCENQGGKTVSDGEGGSGCSVDLSQKINDWNTAYTADRAAFDKESSCPNKPDGSSGLEATTPGAVVSSQITGALGLSNTVGSLDAALGNSISAILNAFMNHFMQQGLSAMSSTVSSMPDTSNWSYMGQSLSSNSSTTTTGSISTLVAPQSATVKVGSVTSATTLSGGTTPYSIATQPDSTIATAQISGTSLTVTGISSGQTSFVIQDSSNPIQSATVQVTVSATGTLIADFNNPLSLQNIYVGTSDINPNGTNVTLQGGTATYNIQTQPDSSVAMAIVSDNTLTIVGVGQGTTSIVLQDSSTPSNTITLNITVGSETALSADPQNATIKVNDMANITISGGTTPYNITTQPDSGIASASISGNTLVVFGTATGTTSVVVQDSYSPAQTITIPIMVGTQTSTTLGTCVVTNLTTAIRTTTDGVTQATCTSMSGTWTASQ
jgi:hypothetical protein